MVVALLTHMGARTPRLTRADAATGLGLGLLVMLAAWHWRATIIPIDPWDYVEGALNFPNGVWNEVGLTRWGMIAPLMLLGALWGNSEATYYAYPLLGAGLLAAVLYALPARLVNRWTGVAAALLTCSASVVFVHLSRGYPDLIAVSFIGLAVLGLVLARDLARGHPETADSAAGWARPVPTIAWIVLSGASFIWAVEARETSVLALPVVVVLLLRIGSPRRAVPAFLVPVLVALLVDAFLTWRYYGDPLLKVRALTGNSLDRSPVDADLAYLGRPRSHYMTVPFRYLWDRSGGPALVIALGIGLVGGAVHRRRVLPLWLWGATVLALLWLLGGVLRPSAPSIRLDIIRYNLAYAVPLVVTAVCVVALVLIALRGWRRGAVAAGAVVLALASLVPSLRFVATFEGLAPNGGRAMRAMGDFLETYPGLDRVRIWADWGTQRIIPVYSRGPFGDPRWEARGFRSLNRLLREPPVRPRRLPAAGDLVVVYSQDDQTCYHCNQALEDVEQSYGRLPMAGWEEVFRAPDGNLIVFRLPDGYVWPFSTPVLPGAASGEAEADEGSVSGEGQ